MLTRFKYGIFGCAMIMMMLVMSSLDISLSSDVNFADINKNEFFSPVIQKLIKRGVDTNFINKIINNPATEFNERFVRINVTGYLSKADYSSQYNNKSVSKSKDFLKDNLPLLTLAELKYNVPKEVIASVLWVETRHGSYLGSSHVASVYLSTAMCNEKQYIDMNLKNLREKFQGSDEELTLLENKINERAVKKANWAIEQLIALEQIDKFSSTTALELKGSWAGAFGISQFIPSSYVQWGVDGDGDGDIDLFSLPDAVFSVGNYLKSNGWGDDETDRRNAVFHYNNSSAYVDAVLKLASLITDKPAPEIQAEIPQTETKIRAQAGGQDY